jgi:hypothetical protein
VFKRNHGPFLHFEHDNFRLGIVVHHCSGLQGTAQELRLSDLERFDQKEVVATLQASWASIRFTPPAD